MADENLHFTIDADADDITRLLQNISNQLNSMSGAATSSGDATAAALNKVGASAENAQTKIGNHKKELDGLTGLLEKASRTGSGVATVFELFGQEAGAAAQHVRLMNEAIKELAVASLPLVAAFAAVEIGIKAFAFFKDAAMDAGRFQQSMAILGATVTAQGGNWKTLSKTVLEYADAQERATTFSRDEVIKGLTQLTAAHMSVQEAMQVNRVAEDASISTGQSLDTVNHALVEAMHGRTQALTMLGIGTKQSIKDGMSFHDVLAAIEKQMGGAAAAATKTLPGALSQLGNAFETLKQDMGDGMQAPLMALVHSLTDLVNVADADLPKVAAAFGTVYDAVANFLSSGPVVATMLGAIAVGAVALGNALISSAVAGLTAFGTAVFDEAIIPAAAFTQELLTEMIPAVFSMANSLIKDGVAALGVFVEVISTQVVPAVIAFGETLLTKTLPAIGETALALIRDAIPAAIGLAQTLWSEVLPALAATAIEFLAVNWPILAVGAAIGGLAYLFATHMQAIEDVVDKVITWVVNRFGDLVRALAEAGKFVGGIFDKLGAHGIASAIDGAAGAMDAFGQRAEQAHVSVKGIVDTIGAGIGKVQQFVSGFLHPNFGSAGAYKPSAPADLPNDNTMVGGGKGGAKKHSATSGYDFKPLADALKPAKQAVDQLDASLKKLPKDIAGYNAAISMLTPVIASEKQSHTELNNQLYTAGQKYEEARKAANEYGEKLKSQTSPVTAEQKRHLKDLETAVTNAKNAYDKIKSSLDATNAALKKHQDELAAAQAAIKKLGDEWSSFQRDAQAKYNEDLQTFRMTNEQKYEYYKQLCDNIQVLDDTSLKQKEQLYQKELDAEKAAIEEREKDEQAAHDKEVQDVQGLLNNLLTQHKTFKDLLKQVYDEILQAFIQMVSQMLVESALFQSIFKNLVPGGGSSGRNIFTSIFSAFTSGGSNAQSLGTTSNPVHVDGVANSIYPVQVTASTSAASAETSTAGSAAPATASSALSISTNGSASAASNGGFNASSLTAPFGGSSGASSAGLVGSSASANGYTLTTGAFTNSDGSAANFVMTNPSTGQSVTADASGNVVSGPSGLSGAGGHVLPSFGTQATFSAIQGAFIGASVGSSVYGGGTHTLWGSLGGAAGGYLGFVLSGGNPLGAAIGELAGSFIGGAFGHADNPAEMPDKYDTANYTRIIGELTGSASTAYGPPYNAATDQTEAQLGGKPMLTYIENWVAAHLSSKDPQIQAVAQQLYQTFGDSGGGKLNFHHNIGEEDVIGGHLSGSYTAIWNAAANAINQIQSVDPQGSMDPMQQFNFSDEAPNMNVSSLTSVGSYDPGANTIYVSGPSSGGSGGGTGGGGNPGGPGGGVHGGGNGGPIPQAQTMSSSSYVSASNGSGNAMLSVPVGNGGGNVQIEVVLQGDLAALVNKVTAQQSRNYSNNYGNIRYSQ